jgi:uncharacterized protein DUF1566
MWEVKSEDSSLDYVSNSYPWAGTCSTSEALCGVAADCLSSGAGQTCDASDGEGTNLSIFQWVAQLHADNFAGHHDWRIPNAKELQSILDYGTDSPAVAAAFNTNCAAACTVKTCSCTQFNFYWSATTSAGDPGRRVVRGLQQWPRERRR